MAIVLPFEQPTQEVVRPTLNALTIDFEDWYQGLEIPKPKWTGFEDRIVSVGRRLLEILGAANVHATFFVLGAVAPVAIKNDLFLARAFS